MAELLRRHEPALVIDATHPYAQSVGENIRKACMSAGAELLRVKRDSGQEQASGCVSFDGMDKLLNWIEKERGGVFVTMGSSAAGVFTGLNDFQNRVWLRILPSVESLSACLNLGYSPERLICMQGPFSQELNRAMFVASGAKILVTKDSGAAGGFSDKVRAAHSLGMVTAVLSKPLETGGVPLGEAK
jgi:precorrin-6x reductase